MYYTWQVLGKEVLKVKLRVLDPDVQISAGGDYHFRPGEECPDMFYEDYRGLLVFQEVFEIIPLGIDAWRTDSGRYTVSSFARNLPPHGCFMVLSNHDGRRKWLQEIVRDYNIVVCEDLDIVTVDRIYHFEHGHKLTEWKVLSWGADDVVQFMTGWNKYLRNWWYSFCRWKGWIPSYTADNKAKYSAVLGLYWANCLREVHKRKNTTYVVGHSHCRRRISRALGCEVINLGWRKDYPMIERIR